MHIASFQSYKINNYWFRLFMQRENPKLPHPRNPSMKRKKNLRRVQTQSTMITRAVGHPTVAILAQTQVCRKTLHKTGTKRKSIVARKIKINKKNLKHILLELKTNSLKRYSNCKINTDIFSKTFSG